MARLFRVIVPVSDFAKGVSFYRRVLGTDGREVSSGRHYFDCEGTILACFDPRADGDPFDATPLPAPLYLAVDDLEGAFEAIEAAGGRFEDDDDGAMGRIAVRPWGERSFYATDPFGNPLCFVDRGTMFTGA